MMILRTVNNVVQQRKVLQDLSAPGCMGLHGGVFLIRQSGGFVQNCVRYTDFADIMHLGRPFNIPALFFIQAVCPGNLCRINGNPFTVVTGSLVLGVHCAGNGDNRLFAHFNLFVGHFQLFLHLPFMSFHQQPCNPAHCKHRNGKDVENEPAVVVHFLFLGYIICTFNNHVLPVIVKHRQMEHIISGCQVCVGNGAQGILGYNRPFCIKALQHIAHIGILDGIVNHFRIDFKTAHTPRNPLCHTPVNPVNNTVHPHCWHTQPVDLRSGGECIGVDHKHACITGQIQFSVIFVIPGP